MITINQVLEILRGDPELDAIGCHFESEPHIRRTPPLLFQKKSACRSMRLRGEGLLEFWECQQIPLAA